MFDSSYERAQAGIVLLKGAIFQLLESSPNGLRNVDIGKTLGIYDGHQGHEGHISRTLLAIMEREGVVESDENKLWRIRVHRPTE